MYLDTRLRHFLEKKHILYACCGVISTLSIFGFLLRCLFVLNKTMQEAGAPGFSIVQGFTINIHYIKYPLAI